MIFDILYHNKGPEQIQEVRIASIYTMPEDGAEPELVMHFHPRKPQQNIPLSEIRVITISND